MELEISDKLTLEEKLFRFLESVCKGQPQAGSPILCHSETLGALFAEPHPDLAAALRHCLDDQMVSLGTNSKSRKEIQVPAFVLGIALAFHNCIGFTLPAWQKISRSDEKQDEVEESADNEEARDPVLTFTEQVVALLPPAENISAVLAFHAVLKHSDRFSDGLGKNRSAMLHSLIERSPLTSLWNLDTHTPGPLNAVERRRFLGKSMAEHRKVGKSG